MRKSSENTPLDICTLKGSGWVLVPDYLTSGPIDLETFVNGNNRADNEPVSLCFSLKPRLAEM